MLKRAYLGGPDVFILDALGIGQRKREICRQHGFEGCYPLDNEIAGDYAPREFGLVISGANEAMMDTCEVMFANITPFRGPNMDIGTGFESGYMRRGGAHIFGYTSSPILHRERVQLIRGISMREDGALACSDSFAIESFDMHENLMIDGAIEKSGGVIVVKPSLDPSPAAVLMAIEAFEACVRIAAERLLGHPA